MKRLIIASTTLLAAQTFAISLSHPSYISLGGGFGSGRNDIKFSTFVPKSTAVKPIDKLDKTNVANMAFEKKEFTLKPKSGLDFDFAIGAVDATNGIGLELQFSYLTTKNKEPGLIPTSKNGTQGKLVNAVGDTSEVKFSNYKVNSGIKAIDIVINALYMPIMDDDGFGIYGGVGFGLSQGEVQYKRTADVAYKETGANKKFGTATNKVLGPQVTSSGWGYVEQLFGGVRIPFEENSAFDIRLVYSTRKTKKITTLMNGFEASDAITSGDYFGMTDANYVAADNTVKAYLVEDEEPRKISHVGVLVSASFSPFL